MFNRYNKMQSIINNSNSYVDIFKQKNLSYIKQYGTYDFKNLKTIDTTNLELTIHVIQPFDKLYMISQKYYESPEYGWIILYTNKLSSELQLKVGSVLNIYFPLQGILELL